MKIKTIVLFILFISSAAIAETDRLPHSTTARLLDGVFSERSEVGDRIEIETLEPINLREQRMFIPMGSILSGKVARVSEAHRGLRNGQISVHFTTLHFPNGYILHVDADMISDEPVGGKNPIKNAASKIRNWASDEPTISGSVSLKERVLQAGKVGVGAIFGGPLGASTAAGSLIFEKGGKVRLQAGDYIGIKIHAINSINSVKGEIYEAKKQSEDFIYKPKPKISQ